MRENNFTKKNILLFNNLIKIPISQTHKTKFNTSSFPSTSNPSSTNSTIFSSSCSSKISNLSRNELSSSKAFFLKQSPLSLINSSHSQVPTVEVKTQDKQIINEKLYNQLISPSPSNKTFLKHDLLSFIMSPFIDKQVCICDLQLYQYNKLFSPHFTLSLNTNNFILLTAEKASSKCSLSYIYEIYLMYNNNKYKIGWIKSNLKRNVFVIYGKKRNNCLYMGRILYSNCCFFCPFKNKTCQMEVEIPLNNKHHKTNENNNNTILNMHFHEFDSAITSKRSLRVTTRNPMWLDYKNEYVMNFTERVRLASKNNFILTYNENNILQFGKIENKVYALDFMFPLSPYQAFCIGISSIISSWKFIW